MYLKKNIKENPIDDQIFLLFQWNTEEIVISYFLEIKKHLLQNIKKTYINVYLDMASINLCKDNSGSNYLER